MSNTQEYDVSRVKLIGKTIRDHDNNSTALMIPEEFAKALGIESSRVSMFLLDDFGGNKHLVVTKYYKEIVMD